MGFCGGMHTAFVTDWYTFSPSISQQQIVVMTAGPADAGDGCIAGCGSSDQCHHDPVHLRLSLTCLPQFWGHSVSACSGV